MNLPIKIRRWWLIAVGGMVVSFLILFVSITRASLMVTILGEKESELRKIPIRLLVKNEDGGMEVITYRLPSVRTLPISPLYKIKSWRDDWWIRLCRNDLEKARMLLLQADKKIAEATILFAGGYPDWAFGSAEGAIDKLKQAVEVVNRIENNFNEKIYLERQTYKAGMVYKKILLRVEGAIDIDKERYEQIMNNLDDWNEKQKN